MHVAKLFSPIKKTWKLLATWGILWIYTLTLRIQWDLSSWKQALCMLVFAVGTVLGFLSIWVYGDRKGDKMAGLYLIEALRAKVKKTWVVLFIPLILFLIAYLGRNQFVLCSFFIAGASSFIVSLYFGRLIRG